MSHIVNKWDYLMWVKVEDCVKDIITRVYPTFFKNKNVKKNKTKFEISKPNKEKQEKRTKESQETH